MSNAQAPSASVWQRRGLILSPQALPGNYRLLQLPTAWAIQDGLLRVAFAARNSANRGQLLSVDLDPHAAMRIVATHYQPWVALQDCAAYAQHGIGPGDAIDMAGQCYLYGSSLNLDVAPYETSVVLFKAQANGSFSPPEEMLGPASNQGLPVCMPAVKRQAVDAWHMWYTGFERWDLSTEPHPDARYSIHHARSTDGQHWTPDEQPSVKLETPHEAGLARPTVQFHPSVWEMWFSVRGPYSIDQPEQRHYRIGYARSLDQGQIWQRCDLLHRFVNPPQANDWDAQMQCYPQVIELADGTSCMLYCGNGYGASGFGYALRLPG